MGFLVTTKQQSAYPFWLISFFFAILILLCHGLVLKAQFMIDDFSYLRPELKLSQYQTFLDFFIKGEAHHFNPLDPLINVQLFKSFATPLPLYAVNLGLFLLNTLGFYEIVRRLTSRPDFALLAATLFAVHPFNAEIISHITLNSALLSAGFLQLSLIFWITRRWVFSFLSFLVGVLFLETALLFPLILGLAVLVYRREADFKKEMRGSLLFVAAALVYFILWFLKAGLSSGLSDKIEHLNLGVGAYGGTLSVLLNWYLGNLLFPDDIVFIRNFPPLSSPGLLLSWISWMLLVTVGVSFLFWKWNKSDKGFALGWFVTGFLFLVPASVIHAYSMGMIIEPYWFYFSSMGFFMLMALLLLELKSKIGIGIWRTLVMAILLYWGIVSWQQHVIGRTEVGYLQNWLQKSPGNLLPRMMLGSLYGYEKRFPIPDDLIGEMDRQVDFWMFKEEFAPAARLLERLIDEKSQHALSPKWKEQLVFARQHLK